MFKYRKNNFGYFISSDKIKGEYGPFDGIFCKNDYLGIFFKNQELEKKYPSYKFSFGFTQKRIFIIGKKGIETIIFNF